MDFSPLAAHRDLVAANIASLGTPGVIQEVVKAEREKFIAAQATYNDHFGAAHKALCELHEEWVKAGQPVDGAAFIENLLNPPPPADAPSH